MSFHDTARTIRLTLGAGGTLGQQWSPWTPSASAAEGDGSSWIKVQSQGPVGAAVGDGGGSGGSGGGAGERQQPAAGAAGTGSGARAGPQPRSWLSSVTPIGSGSAPLSGDTLTDTLAHLVPQHMDHRTAVNRLERMRIWCVCAASINKQVESSTTRTVGTTSASGASQRESREWLIRIKTPI